MIRVGFYDMLEKIPGCEWFTWSEALWLPRMNAFALPSTAQKKNIKEVARLMDRIRAHFGRPCIVHSWLRPTEYNKLIGGAPRSSHITGSAIDFHVRGIDCRIVKKEIQEKKLWPGRGEIDTTNWVHLDLNEGPWFYARKKV